MLQQAIDFQDESNALYELLQPLDEAALGRHTQFNDWTINHVLQHLHYFNIAADLSLTDEDRLLQMLANLRKKMAAGKSLVRFTEEALNGLQGPALLAAWKEHYDTMTGRFAAADPKRRLKWAGPDMSVLSSITARLMETWAHGQEVYDLLGVVRHDTDRIKNIVVIGNNTFGWTFKNRGEPVPETTPYLALTAPSGAEWTFNPPSEDNRITGEATEFCQVVTQTRNVKDTRLQVVGPIAARWMSIAQCFAGTPKDPPPPGSRFTEAGS